jgi:hypothetical protein
MAGYVVMYCNGAVDWSAKLLKVVADSTCEAETATASRCTKAVMFVRELISNMKLKVMGPTALLVDNSALLPVVMKDGASSRTRYFERSTLFVKYAYLREYVTPMLVGTADEVADIFTKAVDIATFEKLRQYFFNAASLKPVRDRAMKLLVKLNSVVQSYGF